jgi:hypothetical protein
MARSATPATPPHPVLGSWFFLLLLPAACRLPFLNEKTKTRRSAMPLGGFVSTRKAYL